MTLALAGGASGCSSSSQTEMPLPVDSGVRDAASFTSRNPPGMYVAPDASPDVGCPTLEPESGASCATGTTCSYPSTSGCPGDYPDTATCQAGTWEIEASACSHNPPAMEMKDGGAVDATPFPPGVDAAPARDAAACPAAEPATGAACAVSADDTCTYPSSDCTGQSDTARCVHGLWQVLAVGCSHNPPAMDAALD